MKSILEENLAGDFRVQLAREPWQGQDLPLALEVCPSPTCNCRQVHVTCPDPEHGQASLRFTVDLDEEALTEVSDLGRTPFFEALVEALALLEAGWRERPGTTELLTWLDEPGTLPWPDRLAAALAEPPGPAERGPTPRWRFLLGSWDALLEQARRPAGPWATEGRHWAFLVLAMAALEGRKPSASTQLWQAWLKLARLHPQYYWKEAGPIPETAPRLSLVDLLEWKIQREPLDVAAWARIRRQLGAIALGWATEVLKASQRGSYPEAARWLAAAVEVHRICGESAQAEALPRSILEAFPRHRAFRQDWERLRCT